MNIIITIIVISIILCIFLPDLMCNVADWYRGLKKTKKVEKTAKIYIMELKNGVLVIKEKDSP